MGCRKPNSTFRSGSPGSLRGATGPFVRQGQTAAIHPFLPFTPPRRTAWIDPTPPSASRAGEPEPDVTHHLVVRIVIGADGSCRLCGGDRFLLAPSSPCGHSVLTRLRGHRAVEALGKSASYRDGGAGAGA